MAADVAHEGAGCLDEDEALDWVDGLTAARERAVQHIETCAACRQLVSRLARASTSSDEPWAVGVAVGGRYVLGSLIGSGAMGLVYEAYDPELDRKVALKLLRPGAAVLGPERLRREGRAMARVSHPNVVPVYDVGAWQGRGFVAMERVDGERLSVRVRAAQGDWSAIVRLFVQAGRGLGAAHRVGVVHRDFKPDNVLVDREGRVQVTDFGLASVESVASMVTAFGSPGAAPQTSFAGTPAYMAPEQLRGEPADAKSDQFAFCVALYEAIDGRRPFVAQDTDGLLAAMRATPPMALRWAPARLMPVLARGLCFDPAARFASIDALLDALERAMHRRISRKNFAASLLVAAMLAGLGWQLRARSRSCEGARDEFGDVWGEARQAAVRHALLASGASYAEGVWQSVERTLGQYAFDWSSAREEVCRARYVQPEQPAELRRAREACLEQRRGEFEALTRGLSTPSPDLAERAAGASQSLSSLRICANVKALRTSSAGDDPEGVRQQLIAVKIDVALGRLDRARAPALDLVKQARRVGERLVEAQALEVLGDLFFEFGDLEASERSHLDAYRVADTLDADYVRVNSALSLAFVATCGRGEARSGRHWVEIGRAALERLGGDDALEASVAFVDGTVLGCLARFDEAGEALAQAVDRFERLPGHEGQAALAALNLATALQYNGRFEASFGAAERAERLLVATYGSRHPLNAEVALSRAVALNALGHIAATRTQLEAALTGFEAVFGATHSQTITTAGALCLNHAQRGEAEIAVACLQTLLERAKQAASGAHPTAGTHTSAVDVLPSMLGEALVDAGRASEALPLLERTRDELRASTREPLLHPYLGFVLTSLGRALLDARREDEARETLEQAGRAFDLYKPGHLDFAAQRFALARALASSDPVRAQVAAADALARLRAAPGEGALPRAIQIETWLQRPRSANASAAAKRR